ncbi:FAD-binding protein [Eggerthellaceae bacterium 3-80]|nr:FAD-binding protein [bacterium D16-34]
MKNLNRRNFLMGGALLGAGAIAGLSGCSAQNLSTSKDEGTLAETGSDLPLPMDITMDIIEESSVELGEITEYTDGGTYDILVIGAGCAGVPAVVTALEEGATVACFQKESKPAANGFGASAVNLDASTPAGLQHWIQEWNVANSYRIRRDLFMHHINYSGEAVSWFTKLINDAGLTGSTYKTTGTIAYPDGEMAATFEISSPGNQTCMEKLAEIAEADGAKFFYSTPAVQLIQESDGTVIGAFGKTADGEYIKVTATKGVILAAGDYMNNDAFVNHYNRDIRDKWLLLQSNRTGDGHILGCMAGSRLVQAPHPRSVHGLIPWFMQSPLLMVNKDGQRFMNEKVPMTSWNAAARNDVSEGEQNILYRFFDADYETKYAGTGAIPPKDALLDPCIDEEKPTSVYDFHNACHRADTIEELCDEVGLPVDEVKKTIARWNELCQSGADVDFGQQAADMKPIDTPPYYCIKDLLGVADINGGFLVNDKYQAITQSGEIIPHLYGAGVCADNVCGGVMWTMPGGFSNSHCYAAGRYTVIHALTGSDKPSKPVSFDEVAEYYKVDGKFQWEDPDTARHEIEIW